MIISSSQDSARRDEQLLHLDNAHAGELHQASSRRRESDAQAVAMMSMLCDRFTGECPLPRS